MKRVIIVSVLFFGMTATAKDQPLNPADFPLTVRVVSYAERIEEGATHTKCEDTSIPGPYDKTAACHTTTDKTTYRDIQLEMGTLAYAASCFCEALTLGEYKARWKDEKNLEILSTDKKGILKSHRYKILSAKQIVRPTTGTTGQVPCAGSRATVDVSSVPAGAEITVDGQFRGSTPSSLELSDGDHTVVVQRRSFKVWERSVRITGGKITLTAELDKAE